MKDRMTVGELARSSGIPDSTIRYYERAGLLTPSGRTTGNYRLYGGDATERLGFIRAAQSSGLALSDIRALLEFRDGVRPCGRVRSLIESRLEDVNRQLEALRHVQHVLRGFRGACERVGSDEDCPVLLELSRPKGEGVGARRGRRDRESGRPSRLPRGSPRRSSGERQPRP